MIDEKKIQYFKETFDRQSEAVERMKESLAGVNAAFGHQLSEVQKWRTITMDLGTSMDAWAESYRKLDRNLDVVDNGLQNIGERSRELVRIMEDFQSTEIARSVA